MNVRQILVAASAAAILVGTSYGALAGSWGVSKGQSSSSIHVVAKAYPQDDDHKPTKGKGKDKDGPQSIVTVDGYGRTTASAPIGGGSGATAGSFGGGIAASVGIDAGRSFEAQGTVAAAFGGTSGSACAGSGCSH